jgi:hypothetical protein
VLLLLASLIDSTVFAARSSGRVVTACAAVPLRISGAWIFWG